MPKLRNLTCSIRWADTGTAFQEYGTCYGDGVVETCIAVPDRPQPFTIHVASKGFIYDGLAVLVFIDGHYQTNRIRVNLVPAKKGVPPDRSELNLTIRQKEKPLGDGLYMGRAWRFDDHNIVPTLPVGVTDSHFGDLGSIEVLVLRCSSSNTDETNESTTSSAAQSDLLDALEHDPEATSTTDDEKDRKLSAKSSKATFKPAEEEEDEPLPFAGLFDGPNDHGRAPYPPPDSQFGHWNWPSHHPAYPQQASYGPRLNGPSSAPGDAPYLGPSPPYAEDPCFYSEEYSRPPPPQDHPSSSHKRVHFDYGRDQGPAADHARYWDGHEGPGSYLKAPPYSDDKYYTPGLSEWYGNNPDQPDERPRQVCASHTYNMQGGEYAARGRAQSIPPQHEVPPYQRGMQGHVPPPSPGGYAPWAGTLPTPQWSTHPMQGIPQAGLPRYFHPQAPPYQPYSRMPHPNAVSGKPDTRQNAYIQGPDDMQKSGNIDPATDKNNANEANQPGNGAVQNQWDNNNNNNNNTHFNTSNGDKWTTNNDNQTSANWENYTTTDNNNATENNDSADSDNDPNGGTGSNNNDDGGGSNEGDQGGGSSWENANNNDQKNNAEGGWNGGNNDMPDAAGGGASWGDKSEKVAATFSQTPGSGIRPLYGPHGAYYAMQFASASAPDIPCDAEEEPRYDVPKPYVDETGSTKQVQPGKGYLYYKKRSHPEYIDHLEEPYAKFVFRYMTKDQVEKELSINLETEPSGNPEIQSFQNMAKDDLIQMLIRAKGALGGEIPPPPPTSTNSTEEAFVKGVPIDPPKQVFLDYDIPLRGGNGLGGTKAEPTFAQGNNKSWDAPNDSTKNAANYSWESKTTNNYNDKAAAGDWAAGADDWGKKNGNSGSKSNADPKLQFSKEAWDQARKQQKSGPPPAPPPRTDTKSNEAEGGGGWDAPGSGAEAKAPVGGW